MLKTARTKLIRYAEEAFAPNSSVLDRAHNQYNKAIRAGKKPAQALDHVLSQHERVHHYAIQKHLRIGNRNDHVKGE